MQLLPHSLLLPEESCYRLKHRILTRPKSPGPGTYEYCYHCSYGHAQALFQSDGDEQYADAFVKSLRRW
jgi:hypothetical protein